MVEINKVKRLSKFLSRYALTNRIYIYSHFKKDINNHGPTFEELAPKDKNITIKEGTGSGAQSFCGAVDRDSRAWSADVNKYQVKNVKVRNERSRIS